MATNWLIKTKLPSGHEVVSKIKKFNEKATRSLPGSMMKTPTEGMHNRVINSLFLNFRTLMVTAVLDYNTPQLNTRLRFIFDK